MTQAKTAVERFALTHWKNAGRRGDAAISNNHSPVMQRGLWMKNAQEQFDRKIGIERHASFFVNAD